MTLTLSMPDDVWNQLQPAIQAALVTYGPPGASSEQLVKGFLAAQLGMILLQYKTARLPSAADTSKVVFS